jgi:hypothetical protein
MRKFIIAAALVSLTAIPAFAGNSISVNAGMNGSVSKPTPGKTSQGSQSSTPSRPPSASNLPSLPPPPTR